MLKGRCIEKAGINLLVGNIYTLRERPDGYYDAFLDGEWKGGWRKSRFEILPEEQPTPVELEPQPTTMSPLEQSIVDIIQTHFNITLDDNKVRELISETIKGNGIENEDTLKADIKEWAQEFLQNQGYATQEFVHGRIALVLNDIDNKLKNIPKGGSPTTIRIEEVLKEEVKVTEFDVSELHFNTPKLVQFVAARLPVYMYGPTGASKTNVCFRIAKELKLPIQSCTLSPQTPKSELMGYKDANGVYQEGVCYKPFVEGGILLINELDNGNAASNAVLNQLTDEEVFFPCGMRTRHKDLVVIATANTLGNGANRQYVGRSPQDKALLNRFVFLHWPWDKKLEARLTTREYLQWGGKNPDSVKDILDTFWRLRQAIDELQIDHILSMRNLLQYARLAATGVDNDTATRCCIFRGLDSEQAKKVIAKARTMPKEDSILGSGNPALGWSNPDTAQAFKKSDAPF